MDHLKKQSGFKSEKLMILSNDVISQCSDHFLTKNVYVSDIGFFPNALHHYRERDCECESCIIIFCSDGKGYYSLNGRNRKTLSKGELILIPPNTPHFYGSDQETPWSIYWLHIKGTSISNLIQKDTHESPISLSIDLSMKFIELFEEAFGILEQGYTMDNLIYASKILEHMLGVIYYGSRPSSYLPNKRSIRAIEKTMLYMNENITKNITLEDLSQSVSFSTAHFSQLFKRSTGYSPIDYFLRLKMQRSCSDLDLSDLTIKEVASQYGIEDPYYFSRLFKKIMGKSPNEYRNTSKG